MSILQLTGLYKMVLLVMQVLSGITICCNGFGPSDSPSQADLEEVAYRLGAACCLANFTHISGLRNTEQVGITRIWVSYVSLLLLVLASVLRTV